MVHAWIAREILRDGGAADVFDRQRRECRLVQLEFSPVGGKDEDSVGGKQASRLSKEPGVVPLQVEVGGHAFGV